MPSSSELNTAKTSKSDEFYTQMPEIEREIEYYKPLLENKAIYCNCDDPDESNFWVYFHTHFSELKLKSRTASFLSGSKEMYAKVYTGGNDSDTKIGIMMKLPSGDFRSPECVNLLRQTDIIITNPPFSLFREYIELLMALGKQFLILGNINALSYKEFFPYIRNNQIWLGATIHSGDIEFRVPDDYPLKAAGTRIDNLGRHYIRVKGIRWFTNMNYNGRNKPLELTKTYNAEDYPKYDNCDAIEVGKTSDIPVDYKGVMGVPITFIDKYDPEQFDIIAIREDENGNKLVFTREQEIEFNNTFASIHDTADKTAEREALWAGRDKKYQDFEPIDYFFPVKLTKRAIGTFNGVINGKETYRRILIKHKQREE